MYPAAKQKKKMSYSMGFFVQEKMYRSITQLLLHETFF